MPEVPELDQGFVGTRRPTTSVQDVQHYIRLLAFDSTRGVESVAMCFIVNRPANEAGFRLTRAEVNGRTVRYTVQGYGLDRPEGERYL